MNKGILFGVGVGPGDPELMTLKAVRLIHENLNIAVPGENVQDTIAYKIAVSSVPELADKNLIPLHMPMTHDKNLLEKSHKKCAQIIENLLCTGENVIFLTLGDPTIYSTFSYLQAIVENDGFETQLVSGIPSFCASAAALNCSLVEWNESLHVIPVVHELNNLTLGKGNYVLMKSGKRIGEVKDLLFNSGKDVRMIENCGMENEKIYHNIEEIPEHASYYSLIIAKDSK